MTNTIRMLFGNPHADTFTIWGWWGGATASSESNSILVDSNWNLTDAGKAYEQLLGIHDWGIAGLPMWTTDLTTVVGADGKINFNGFYGDYEITVGNQTYLYSFANPVPEPSVFGIMTFAAALAFFSRRSRKMS